MLALGVQGQDVKVLILEVDAERRRLSLSMKRVDGGGIDSGEGDDAMTLTPNLGLSEEVFAERRPVDVEVEDEVEEAEEADLPSAGSEPLGSESLDRDEPEALEVEPQPADPETDEPEATA